MDLAVLVGNGGLVVLAKRLCRNPNLPSAAQETGRKSGRQTERAKTGRDRQRQTGTGRDETVTDSDTQCRAETGRDTAT